MFDHFEVQKASLMLESHQIYMRVLCYCDLFIINYYFYYCYFICLLITKCFPTA